MSQELRALSVVVAALALGALSLGACGRPLAPSDGGTTTNASSGDATAEPSDSSDSGDSSDSSSSSSSSSTGPDETDSQTDPTLIFVDTFDTFEDGGWVTDCDPFFQDCPDGEKCAAYASDGVQWDANKCVPIIGGGAPGEACEYFDIVEGQDDCDDEGMCFNAIDDNGALVGTCAPYCRGSLDDPLCPDQTECFIGFEGSVNVCLSPCDPLVQDCAEGLGCHWADTLFACLATTSPNQAGDPCDGLADCDPGLMCLNSEVVPGCGGSACCSAFCEVGALDGPCALIPDTTCVPFFEQPPPGQENIGVCAQL